MGHGVYVPHASQSSQELVYSCTSCHYQHSLIPQGSRGVGSNYEVERPLGVMNASYKSVNKMAQPGRPLIVCS